MTDLTAAIEQELRAEPDGLPAAELARRLRRRKQDVQRALRADTRFTSTGRSRATRWALAPEDGARQGTAREPQRGHESTEAGGELPRTGTRPENAADENAPEDAADRVAGNLRHPPAWAENAAESAEPEHPEPASPRAGTTSVPPAPGRTGTGSHERADEPEHDLSASDADRTGEHEHAIQHAVLTAIADGLA